MKSNKKHVELNYDETRTCMVQGELFRYVANEGTDMNWFTMAYLNSDFCRREMDTIYSRFQSVDELEQLDFLLPEIGLLQKQKDNKIFDPDIAFWIGFMYRQLYIETGIFSRELAKQIPFDKMCSYYPGFHTIDEEMATDIICEQYNWNKIER